MLNKHWVNPNVAFNFNRLSRLPVDRRRRRHTGQAAYPPDRPHAATLYATQYVNTLWTAAYD